MKFNWNPNIFIQENALENVICEMASILSHPQCVKGWTKYCRLHRWKGQYWSIILCMRPANERWCYIVRSSPIAWMHSQNYPSILFLNILMKTKALNQLNDISANACLLVSPGHQQPWYCIYKINRSLFSLWKCFSYLSIKSLFSTCHGSWAAMACAKLWPDCMIIVR